MATGTATDTWLITARGGAWQTGNRSTIAGAAGASRKCGGNRYRLKGLGAAAFPVHLKQTSAHVAAAAVVTRIAAAAAATVVDVRIAQLLIGD